MSNPSGYHPVGGYTINGQTYESVPLNRIDKYASSLYHLVMHIAHITLFDLSFVFEALPSARFFLCLFCRIFSTLALTHLNLVSVHLMKLI
jgi:hypothetical protein